MFTEPDFPEAGIQIPGGTLEADESPREGVLREAIEETGRSDVAIVRYLGDQWFEMPDRNELHHRHYYHLACTGDPPEQWDHFELTPSTGEPEPIRLAFRWWSLDADPPALAADLGSYLDRLKLPE